MKVIEAICFFSFMAAWMAAECIPLCVLCFAVSLGCGILCAKEVER